jgi:hypothetical protein
MLLFAGVAAVGVVVALGLHTPFYRFLFDSCGPLFRAIRAPSRGVVLFHIGLGVLAAAGLSRLAGRFSRMGRRLTIAAGLLLVGVEYRAWPIDFHAVEAEPPPVYRWLARTPLPGAVLEWPLGFPADYEYEFRSTTHWKPIANGASGFAPPLYGALWAEMRKNTIPDAVWDRVRDVEASVLVFHPHDSPPAVLTAALGALRRGLAAGRLEILESLPHGPQDLDYVFRVASAPPFDARVPPGRLHLARESFENVRLRPGPDPAPPLLVLDFPVEGGEVSAGQWAFGWAADDSGIARVRVTTETGLDVPATFGGDRPDVAKLLLGYADSAHPGLHFAIPALPPGEHVFVVTAQAVDGGKTELRRPVRVR